MSDEIRLDCPKCGYQTVDIRYFRFRDTREERLSCHCERCRYRWNQPVLEEGKPDGDEGHNEPDIN